MVKESIHINESDIKAFQDQHKVKVEFLDKITEINLENVRLSEETEEVAAHISGYNAKKLVKKFEQCCKSVCVSDSSEECSSYDYLNILSRGGLIVPS